MEDRGWQPRRGSWQSSSQGQRGYEPRDGGYPRRPEKHVDSWRPEDDRDRERGRDRNDGHDERRDWADPHDSPTQRRRRGGRGRRPHGPSQDGDQWSARPPFPPPGPDRRGQRWGPPDAGYNRHVPSPARQMRDGRSQSPRSRRSPHRGPHSEGELRSRTGSVRRSRSRSRSVRGRSRSRSRSRSPMRTPMDMDTSAVIHETYIPPIPDSPPPPALERAPLPPPPSHALPPRPSFPGAADLPPRPVDLPHRPHGLTPSHVSLASASPASAHHVPITALPSRPLHTATPSHGSSPASVHPRSEVFMPYPPPPAAQNTRELATGLPVPLLLGKAAHGNRRAQAGQQQAQETKDTVVEMATKLTPEQLQSRIRQQKLKRWREARVETIKALLELDVAEAELSGHALRKQMADEQLERAVKGAWDIVLPS